MIWGGKPIIFGNTSMCCDHVVLENPQFSEPGVQCYDERTGSNCGSGTAIMENGRRQEWPFFKQEYLGGGFKYFLCSPLFGEDSHFDWYFSKGLKPPTRYQSIMLKSKFHFGVNTKFWYIHVFCPSLISYIHYLFSWNYDVSFQASIWFCWMELM